MKPIQSIAIIGAGMAGISCATSLQSMVPNVTVFEKSKHIGGRMVSRVRDERSFDCGAQYFTVRSDAFKQQVERWGHNWLVHEWKGWLVDLHQGQAMSRDDKVQRFCGRPHMHSCVADMADNCEIIFKARVGQLVPHLDAWQLLDDQQRSLGVYDAVVVATPAPQALPLLEQAPKLSAVASTIKMTSCWSVMLSFSDSLGLGFDGAFTVHPKLSWLAQDSSKRDRSSQQSEAWVLHGSPEWSDSHLDLPADQVIAELLLAMQQVCGRKIPEPEYVDAKLWRYAMPVNPLDQACLYDSTARIGACGDWCYSARVEGAYLSGVAMAAAILRDA